jgi:hypothetical protein
MGRNSAHLQVAPGDRGGGLLKFTLWSDVLFRGLGATEGEQMGSKADRVRHSRGLRGHSKHDALNGALHGKVNDL